MYQLENLTMKVDKMEGDHLSDDQEEDREMNSAYVAHHKPLGKHRLLWGKAGKRFPSTCLLGPDWPCLAFSFILIWGTTLGIMIGINPGRGPPLVYLLGVASLFLVTFFLSGAAFSDPGIIPKRERSVHAREADALPPTDSETGRTLCGRCLVYRPRGAFHCRDCDACILDLDHHCPWTGHCIGELNLRYFQAYLCFLLLHVIVVIALAMLLSLSIKHV